jgi:hypothetical protein
MMGVAHISRTTGPFELVERDVPEPGPNTVRVAVFGRCRSVREDLLVERAGARSLKSTLKW